MGAGVSANAGPPCAPSVCRPHRDCYDYYGGIYTTEVHYELTSLSVHSFCKMENLFAQAVIKKEHSLQIHFVISKIILSNKRVSYIKVLKHSAIHKTYLQKEKGAVKPKLNRSSLNLKSLN